MTVNVILKEDSGSTSSRLTTICLALIVASLPFVSSCSLQKLAVKQTANVLVDGSVALYREPDVEFARTAIPANLKTLESLLVSDPENAELLELMAEGHFSYAFGFLEHELAQAQVELAPEDEIEALTERTVGHYMRARDYGFRLLDFPELEKAAMKPDVEKVKELLEEVDEDQVAGLFWAGYGWGSAVNLAQQDPNMVAALPIVEAIMRRCAELDESYYFSGVHMFFGVYYASRPKMAGGDPEKAKKHFDIAMEKAGRRNLMIPFLYARFYGAQTQNRELFDKLMGQILEADFGEHPDTRLFNELAKERAEFWTDHADELFY